MTAITMIASNCPSGAPARPSDQNPIIASSAPFSISSSPIISMTKLCCDIAP